MGTAVGLVVGVGTSRVGGFTEIGALTDAAADMERAVGTAVGDSDLRLYRWAPDGLPPDGGRWRRPDWPQQPLDSLDTARTEIRVGSRPLALLVHDPELAHQRTLLAVVAALTAAALARADAAAAFREGELAEQFRIAESVHSEVQNPLLSLRRELLSLSAADVDDHRPLVDAMVTRLVGMETRLGQIIRNIYPESLVDFGLGSGFREYVRQLGQPDERVHLSIAPGRWHPDVER